MTYEYPFGLWLVGAQISNITGIEVFDISYILPLIIIAILILIYYAYSGTQIKPLRYRLLSIAFLLSMPVVLIDLLDYRTSVFSMPFTLGILYLMLDRKTTLLRYLTLASLLAFCTCITHTGTYIFLIFFSLAYAPIYSLISGKLDKKAYLLIMILLAVYAVTANAFPNIQVQYVDKSRLILTVGDFLSQKLHLPLAIEASSLFYQKIFIDGDLIQVTLWSGFIYALLSLAVAIRGEILRLIRRNRQGKVHLTIPLIGSISNMSHSIWVSPFWLGPIQFLLSFAGLLSMNDAGKALLAATVLVTMIPGSLVGSLTGSVREIFYMCIALPIAAAFGMNAVENALSTRRGPGNRAMLFLALFTVYASIVIAPIVGNLYYKPPMGGTEGEIGALQWLKGESMKYFMPKSEYSLSTLFTQKKRCLKQLPLRAARKPPTCSMASTKYTSANIAKTTSTNCIPISA